MAKQTFIDQSKLQWIPSGDDDAKCNLEQLQVGCPQRIAAATESMAVNHVQLQRDYDYMKRDRDYYLKAYEKLQRRFSAQKAITEVEICH